MIRSIQSAGLILGSLDKKSRRQRRYISCTETQHGGENFYITNDVEVVGSPCKIALNGLKRCSLDEALLVSLTICSSNAIHKPGITVAHHAAFRISCRALQDSKMGSTSENVGASVTSDLSKFLSHKVHLSEYCYKM